MMYSFITGIPVSDILAILYYVKRLYPEKFSNELVNELILAKGIPTEEQNKHIIKLIKEQEEDDIHYLYD